jgi:hypothetical protein
LKNLKIERKAHSKIRRKESEKRHFPVSIVVGCNGISLFSFFIFKVKTTTAKDSTSNQTLQKK